MRQIGILVGRPATRSLAFIWSIVPRDETSYDEAQTDLFIPHEELFMVNMRRATIVLRNLYIVRFVPYDMPAAGGGFMTVARDPEIVARIRLAEFEERLSEVDDKAYTVELKEPPEDFEEMLMELHRLSNASGPLIKRFYSTPVLFDVETGDGRARVMVSIKEAYLYLEENPGEIERIYVLPRYRMVAVKTRNPVPYEVFEDEVVGRAVKSSQMFDAAFRRVVFKTARAGGEEEL